MSQKELLKRYEVFKTRGGPEMHEDYKSGYYKEQMPKIDLGEDKVYGKPKDYVYPPEEPKEEIDWDILDSFKNDPTWLKIKKWLEERKGHATGGVSNLFRQRQGFRAGTAIELVKGARWVIRMLKELADDMIFGGEQFAKIAEPEKIRLYKETQAAEVYRNLFD